MPVHDPDIQSQQQNLAFKAWGYIEAIDPETVMPILAWAVAIRLPDDRVLVMHSTGKLREPCFEISRTIDDIEVCPVAGFNKQKGKHDTLDELPDHAFIFVADTLTEILGSSWSIDISNSWIIIHPKNTDLPSPAAAAPKGIASKRINRWI